jgi:2-oxo-4-hydroxy-4-carboxy-5-ureidoimidazoline decarboxylase
LRVTTSSTVTLSLSDFNALPVDECLSILHSFLDVDSWDQRLCSARPYLDVDDLVAASAVAGLEITPPEILGALDRHPRIGARLADGSRESAWSEREQAQVHQDAAAADELAAGNATYEARFGFIFLVCAAGRSAAEILDVLRSRLGNDPDHELLVVRGELLDIAAGRIRALMTT